MRLLHMGDLFEWSNEAISSTGYSLDKPRLVGIISQGGSDLPDARVDSQVEVDKRILIPKDFFDVLAAHHLAGSLNEQNEYPSRLGLQLHRHSSLAQSARVEVEAKRGEMHRLIDACHFRLLCIVFLRMDYTDCEYRVAAMPNAIIT
jgi:hypothetical protein